ncbi:MAG: aldo/keto reductase [Dehalococcoidia bacterium]|nr:aldo/keto reductase [Dehalococcoidia bacterium]
METRRLGRTGHFSSVVTLGGATFGRSSQDQADAAVELALAHGINHIDVAPTYGDAELRLSRWLPTHRKGLFLGCKTTKRSKEEAWASLNHSLESLAVDRLDLFQLHAITDLAELDKVSAPGGAIEALVEARNQGLTRFLGITGHGHLAPSTHLEALRRFDFDTVLLPLNFILWAREDYRRDFLALLAEARRRDIGIIIIKTVAQRPWAGEAHTHGTWYRPFADPEQIARCVRFVLSQGVTTLASPGDTRLLPMVIKAAEEFSPMPAAEQMALVATAGQYSTIFTEAGGGLLH